ncbi:hypothetical protein CHARACLAT_019269 [Characodon lateralis]|uniref:Uncharacterized protein n=1 Tax=Characodon lateralis TaxID=208331 RepID=A0ABU7E5X3_9TELE|nr:hypothetical protein [Characodon lateralis]
MNSWAFRLVSSCSNDRLGQEPLSVRRCSRKRCDLFGCSVTRLPVLWFFFSWSVNLWCVALVKDEVCGSVQTVGQQGE